MITYNLIEGGYEIYINDAKIIHQPHSPTRGIEVQLTPTQAENIARLICKKLEAGLNPIVEMEEETELLQETAIEEKIDELVQIALNKKQQIIQQEADLQQRIADLEAAMAAILGGAGI